MTKPSSNLCAASKGNNLLEIRFANNVIAGPFLRYELVGVQPNEFGAFGFIVSAKNANVVLSHGSEAVSGRSWRVQVLPMILRHGSATKVFRRTEPASPHGKTGLSGHDKASNTPTPRLRVSSFIKADGCLFSDNLIGNCPIEQNNNLSG